MTANPLMPWTSLMDFLGDAAVGGLIFVALFLLVAWLGRPRGDQ